MLAKIASFLTNELQPKLRTQSSHDVCYFSKICCFIPLLTPVLSQLLFKSFLKTRDFKLSLIRESLKNIFISTAGVSFVSLSRSGIMKLNSDIVTRQLLATTHHYCQQNCSQKTTLCYNLTLSGFIFVE